MEDRGPNAESQGRTHQEEPMDEVSESQDLTKVEFATALRGYDKEEVDTFLRELADEHNRLLTELATTKRSAEKAYQEMGEEIGDLLQHAKDVADQMRKKAEEEAANTKETARRAAERTVAEAENKADSLRRAAESDAIVRVREAQQKVSSLQDTEQQVRTRLYSLRMTIETLGEQIQGAEANPEVQQDVLEDSDEISALGGESEVPSFVEDTSAPEDEEEVTSPAPLEA